MQKWQLLNKIKIPDSKTLFKQKPEQFSFTKLFNYKNIY